MNQIELLYCYDSDYRKSHLRHHHDFANDLVTQYYADFANDLVTQCYATTDRVG